MSVTQARTPQSHPHLKWFRLQANIPMNGQFIPVNYPHIVWAVERQANGTFWVSGYDTRTTAWYGRPCSDENRAPLRVWQWAAVNRLLSASLHFRVALAPQQVNLPSMSTNEGGSGARVPDDADRMLTLAQELGVVCQGVFNALTDKVKRMMASADVSPGDGVALRLTATVIIGQGYRMLRASGIPSYAVRSIFDGICNQQEESIQTQGIPGPSVGHAVALSSSVVDPVVDLDTPALPPAVFAQPPVPEGGPQTADVDPREVN